MADGLAPDVWVIYILPFVVPALTALVVMIRKQGTVDQRSSLTDYNVTTIRQDLTEVKGDVKELRKDQAEINNTIISLQNLTTRVQRLEGIHEDQDRRIWPRFENALRQIDIIKVKLANLENRRRMEATGTTDEGQDYDKQD